MSDKYSEKYPTITWAFQRKFYQMSTQKPLFFKKLKLSVKDVKMSLKPLIDATEHPELMELSGSIVQLQFSSVIVHHL